MLREDLPSTDHRSADNTCDWLAIDRTLRGLARKRAALDAEEASLLRTAYQIQIWREVGCVSMIDYMERYLGYGVRNAQERLRVALALDGLPAIAGALASGELPFTAVRTLLRVATPATERQWLAHCAGRSVHQIEEAVSGRAQGDSPTDPARPDLELRTLRYTDVRPWTVALEREALAKARAAHGGHLTHDEFLATVFGAFLERGAGRTPVPEPALEPTPEPEPAPEPAADPRNGRAKYQVAIVVCGQCNQAWRESAGTRFALDASELARVHCDAQHIGALDTTQPTRATQDVPPRIRRLVWRRDRGRCTIDGCRSAANLEIHHLIPREDGGTHDAWNLTLACDACHAAIHRGLITVTGKAPDAIVVTRKHAPAASAPSAPSAFDRAALDVEAKKALVQAGFSRSEAAVALASVRAEVERDLPLDALLREALRRCRKPT